MVGARKNVGSAVRRIASKSRWVRFGWSTSAKNVVSSRRRCDRRSGCHAYDSVIRLEDETPVKSALTEQTRQAVEDAVAQCRAGGRRPPNKNSYCSHSRGAGNSQGDPLRSHTISRRCYAAKAPNRHLIGPF